jgi:hypothetical protein
MVYVFCLFRKFLHSTGYAETRGLAIQYFGWNSYAAQKSSVCIVDRIVLYAVISDFCSCQSIY